MSKKCLSKYQPTTIVFSLLPTQGLLPNECLYMQCIFQFITSLVIYHAKAWKINTNSGFSMVTTNVFENAFMISWTVNPHVHSKISQCMLRSEENQALLLFLLDIEAREEGSVNECNFPKASV